MESKIISFVCPNCNNELLFGREFAVEAFLDKNGRHKHFKVQTIDTEFGYAGSLKCNSCDFEYWLADDKFNLFEDEIFKSKIMELADKQHKALSKKCDK